jgi:hypothetical protein
MTKSSIASYEIMPVDSSPAVCSLTTHQLHPQKSVEVSCLQMFSSCKDIVRILLKFILVLLTLLRSQESEILSIYDDYVSKFMQICR